MKFLVSFVMFFLFLNCFATAGTLIQDSCKKAAAGDPDFNYGFCVQSLEKDPQSKKATTLEELFVASTKKAASKTIEVKGILEKILKAKKFPPTTMMAFRDCLEFYDDANGSLNDAVSSFYAGDYGSIGIGLSGALDAPTDCEDGIKEMHAKSPVSNENNILFQTIAISLDFSAILGYH